MYYIITKKNFDCKWCKSADDLLWHSNLERETIALPREVLRGLGIKTVPQIFQDENLIGGYEDLVKHLSPTPTTEIE